MSPLNSGAEKVREAIEQAGETTPEPPRPLMRELPPADPFPVDSLGDILAPAARAIHDRVQAPLAICGQSVLAAATLSVQAHGNIKLPTAQEKPLTNFFLTVAATGERKTAVDTEALWPVRKREEALLLHYDSERTEYENARTAWEKAREHAAKTGKGDRARITAELDAIGLAPLPPLQPLLTCPEPTYEGLCKLFPVGWPSLGIFASEGGQFIGGHGMSDDAKLRTAAGLSALWDGEAIKRVRSGDGTICLPGRRLALHLMAQPHAASTLLTDPLLADQGLLSRILATAPDAASGTRAWHEPSPESERAMKRYGARLLSILEHPLPLTVGAHNALSPPAVPLSPPAVCVWKGFYNHVETRVSDGGELAAIRGLANKMPEHAARLAAVLTLVKDIKAVEVGRTEMEAGIELVQHYASEGLRLEGASHLSEKLKTAQVLLNWLRSSWNEVQISLPDVYRLGPERIRTKETASRAIAILEDHGWLMRVPGGAVVAGKQRRDVWRIIRG